VTRQYRKTALAAAVAGALVAPAAHAAEPDRPDSRSPWAAHVTLDLPAAKLGVGAKAARVALARAGARRAAARIGISRAELGDLQALPRHASAPAGSTQLRQSLGGLRVLWSQLDVTAASGRVGTVSGTLVPLKGRLTGRVRISPARAVTIARNRVAGPDSASPAQLVAYAGGPEHPRAPRRAYVVAVDPESQQGDSPSADCVVIDAETGRVLTVWKGTVAPAPEPPGATTAATDTVLAQYEDAKGRKSDADSAIGFDIWDLHTNGVPALTYDTTGGFFTSQGNPTPLAAAVPGPPTSLMRVPIDLSTNVARSFCLQQFLNWCGRDGLRPAKLGPGYHRWFYTINWGGKVSQFKSSQQRIYIARGFNAIDEATHAHEIGHDIDFFSRSDFQQTFEGLEVQEAIAEMFAYSYFGDRPAVQPGTCSMKQFMDGSQTCQLLDDNGQSTSVPHAYTSYNCTTPDEHVNGYILGKAFFTIVSKAGFKTATRLLAETLLRLPAKRTFGSVHTAFEDSATAIINSTNPAPSSLKQTVHDAFADVGVTTAKTRTSTCPGSQP
jgi:hypothetical protein